MPSYRFYCLDGGGRIGFAEWIQAPDDEEAIDEAKALRPDASRCEIWQDNRLVATLKHGSLVAEANTVRQGARQSAVQAPLD